MIRSNGVLGDGVRFKSHSPCLSRICGVWIGNCYPPCLSEAVDGVLVHPFEVVHIEQIGPPEYFFMRWFGKDCFGLQWIRVD